MSHTIEAVFDSGVFRPLAPVDLPNGTRVEIIPLPQATSETAAGSDSWPAGYFEQTAGVLAGEQFERPRQGDLPLREDW